MKGGSAAVGHAFDSLRRAMGQEDDAVNGEHDSEGLEGGHLVLLLSRDAIVNGSCDATAMYACRNGKLV